MHSGLMPRRLITGRSCHSPFAPSPRSQLNIKRASHQVVGAQKVSDLPQNLKKIVGAFQMVPDPMARYKQLLFYATKLSPLPAEDHNSENKVEGCVSQVWVKPELRGDGLVYWAADSDSQLTKGLAALLVNGLSGCTPQEILQVEPTFIEMLGLKQSLTPSRNNGFLNMLKLMQRKTLALVSDSKGSSMGFNGSNLPEASTSGCNSQTPVQDSVRQKLTGALKPTKLEIIDESHKHAGHAAMRAVSPGKASGTPGETHFIVEIVSEAFEGVPVVKRHRMVYQLLDQEMATMGLHALSLNTKAPSEASQERS